MEDFTAISKVSADFNISSRTLRYWESAGLFQSVRDPESGWRIYDENALQCIRVTDLLRRLDFSIKEIKEVLEKKTVSGFIGMLRKQLTRLDKTGTDLQTRRDAIADLIEILENEYTLSLAVLENHLQPIAVERKKHVVTQLQRGETKMENIQTKFDRVQYVTLPSSRTVAYNAVSKEPEGDAMKPIFKWIEENNLKGTARYYLFNIESPGAEEGEYGMGCCATIPEGVEIPDHLYELRLPGGDYVTTVWKNTNGPYDNIWAVMGDKDWEWQEDRFRPGHSSGLEEHIEIPGGGFIIQAMLPVRKKIKMSKDQTFKEQITAHFEGEALDVLLDFGDFMLRDGLTAKKSDDKNYCIYYKGRKVCRLRVMRADYWIFSVAIYTNFTDTETYQKFINDEQREFLLANFRINLPKGCGDCGHKGYGSIEVLGQKFETYCSCYPLYTNFNKIKEDLNHFELMKQLVLANKNALDYISAEEDKVTYAEIIKDSHLRKTLEKDAIDFVAFMNENFDKSENPDDPNGWYYLGERVCHYKVGIEHFGIMVKSQSIITTSDYESPSISDEIKEFAWTSVGKCHTCQGLSDGQTIKTNPCRQGDDIIWGKKFDNLCHNAVSWWNPDTKTFKKIKELMLAWKQYITEIKSNK